jgi:hypothetical protein
VTLGNAIEEAHARCHALLLDVATKFWHSPPGALLNEAASNMAYSLEYVRGTCAEQAKTIGKMQERERTLRADIERIREHARVNGATGERALADSIEAEKKLAAVTAERDRFALELARRVRE